MIDEEHFRKLERMYHAGPINQIYQPKLVITEGRAEVTMRVDERFYHTAGALHGSVYFKMLDDASFFAANSLVTDLFLLTVDFNIHMLKPIRSSVIRSVGELTFSSASLFVAEARLYTEDNKEAAFGSGSFLKSRIPLSQEIGYK